MNRTKFGVRNVSSSELGVLSSEFLKPIPHSEFRTPNCVWFLQHKMRILDRYTVRQLLPVWLWCLTVFILLSCLIDLFEHLDEILRYHIPVKTIWQYYLNFIPLVVVRASPLALLFSAAFVSTRLVRHQELF